MKKFIMLSVALIIDLYGTSYVVANYTFEWFSFPTLILGIIVFILLFLEITLVLDEEVE